MASSSRQSSSDRGPFARLKKLFKWSYSTEVVGDSVLSDYHKHLVKGTWSKIDDDKDIFGQIIFLRIFQAQPKLKFLFMWEDISTEMLCHNPQFRKHTLAVMNTIGKCVKHINALEKTIKPQLVRLGRTHTRFKSFGFTPFYWELFQLSLITSITSEYDDKPDRQHIIAAWEKLIVWIIEQMRQGYEQNQLVDETNSEIFRNAAAELDRTNSISQQEETSAQQEKK